MSANRFIYISRPKLLSPKIISSAPYFYKILSEKFPVPSTLDFDLFYFHVSSWKSFNRGLSCEDEIFAKKNSSRAPTLFWRMQVHPKYLWHIQKKTPLTHSRIKFFFLLINSYYHHQYCLLYLYLLILLVHNQNIFLILKHSS